MVICGYPIVDGSPCHNFPRQGKKYCWMHDGTPKKNERLQAEIAKLKEYTETHMHTIEDVDTAYINGWTDAEQALTGE